MKPFQIPLPLYHLTKAHYRALGEKKEEGEKGIEGKVWKDSTNEYNKCFLWKIENGAEHATDIILILSHIAELSVHENYQFFIIYDRMKCWRRSKSD